MRLTKVNILVLLSAMIFVASAQASDQNELQYQEVEIEILSGAEEQDVLFSPTMNPPGSTWITVRCERNRTCYPPAGYKYRHFNTELRGSDCRGSEKRRVKQTKDYIQTSRKCTVTGRVFIIPAQYCRGNYRFCS